MRAWFTWQDASSQGRAGIMRHRDDGMALSLRVAHGRVEKTPLGGQTDPGAEKEKVAHFADRIELLVFTGMEEMQGRHVIDDGVGLAIGRLR